MTELELYIVCNLIRKKYEVDANSIFSKTYLDLMYHEAKKQPDLNFSTTAIGNLKK